MKKSKKTIGQEADRIAKIYIKIFEKLRKDKDIEIRSQAENLARHDLIQAKIINRMALEQLEEYMAKENSHNIQGLNNE